MAELDHPDRHVGAEVRRPGRRSHLSDPRRGAGRVERPRLQTGRYRLALDGQTTDLTHGPFHGGAQKRIAADATDGHEGIAEAAEAAFVGGVVPCHVVAVGQQLRLDALDQVRAAGLDLQVGAVGHQGIPKRLRQLSRLQVDLEAALLRIARASDDQLASLKGQDAETEEADVAHTGAEDPRHQFLGLRALHRQRRDIRFGDVHIQPEAIGKSLGPEQKIAVGDGNPVPILGQLDCNRIVQHAAGLVDHRRVVAASRHHGPQVARRQHLQQTRSLAPPNLDLALTTDIPDLHVALEMMVVGLQSVEGRRQQHMIVDGIGLNARPLDPVGEGRAPNAPRRREGKGLPHLDFPR